MKRGWVSFLLCMLLLSPWTMAMAGAPVIDDLSDNTVGYRSATLVDTDISFSEGEEYTGGSLSISINSGTSYDQISFINNDDPNLSGALSITDGLLYLGNGSGKDIIGTFDNTENGENGNTFTLNFTRSLTNQGFETGDTMGWTVYEDEYTEISLYARSIEYTFDSGTTTGTGSIINPGVYVGLWGIIVPSYIVVTDADNANSGNYSLELATSARLDTAASNIDRPDGNGSMHGPYVISDPFEASTNDVISFDWYAQAETDAYEVLGFLVDASDARTEIFSQRGSTHLWTTETVIIPQSGTYRLEFICGSYDRDGNRQVGARFNIDNIQLRPFNNPNDDVLSAIARHITYENTNNSGTGETRTVTLTAQSGDGSITSASSEITLTTTEGPEPFITLNNDLSVSLGESSVIDTAVLDAADPDSPDESLLFRVDTAPSYGQLEYTTQPGTPITTFSHQDLENKIVRYVHDGTNTSSDSLVFTVSDGTYILPDQIFTITINAIPIPVLTTTDASDITATGFTIGGTFDDQGTSSITGQGFCWSTDTDPTLADNHVAAENQGDFQGNITGLIPGMTYYIRAYAENESGVVYGNTVTVQTLGNSLLGSSWNNAASWSRGTVPGSYDDVFLGLNSNLGDLSIMIDEDTTLLTITIADTFEGSLTLSPGLSLTVGVYIQNGGTVNASLGTMVVSGDFILNNGRFTAPAQSLTITGDFIHNGGTFDAGNGVVVLNGSGQTITGETVFYNLSKTATSADTLTFGSDAVLHVTGALTLEGASENEQLVLSCSATQASLVIENNSLIHNLVSDECVEWIFQTGADVVSALPVAVLTNTPPSATRALTYEISVGGLGVTHYRYNLDGLGWNGEFAVDTPITFTLADEGVHTLDVLGRNSDDSWQSTDSPTSVAWLVDTTAPVARVSGCPRGIMGPDDLLLTVSGEDESIILYSYSINGSDWSAPATAESPIVLAGLGEGSHSLFVIASDRVGNWQSTDFVSEYSWTFDAQTPAVTLVGVPDDPTASKSAAITVAGPGLTGYLYRMDGDSWIEATVDEDIVLSGLTDGRHTLEVSGLNESNTAGDDPDGTLCVSWTVDTLASHAPVLAAAQGRPAATSVDLSWSWSADDPNEVLSRYRVFMSRTLITDETVSQAEELICDLTPASQGAVETFTVSGLFPSTPYHFAVRTVDKVGNLSQLSSDVTLTTVSTVPTVSSVTVSGSGSSAENGMDKDLIITGSNFSGFPGGDIIRFENSSNVFDISSSSSNGTQLLAILPAGAPAGTYDIRVINDMGRSKALADAFTIIRSSTGIPVVTGLTPSMVARGNTESLTISGEYFSNPVMSVRFKLNDTTSLTPDAITRVSSEKLNVDLNVAADAAEGSYSVVVMSQNGLSNKISAANLKVVAAQDLNTAEGDVSSTGIITVTDGNVTVPLTLSTDNGIDAPIPASYPLSVVVSIPAGSTIETWIDNSWALYSGNVAAPVQDLLADNVAAQLGDYGSQFFLGGDTPLRLAGGTPILVTVEITVIDGAPVPSLYVVNDDNSVSLAGISGSSGGVFYEPGGTILLIKEDVPEDGLTTYTLGVMLDQLDSTYALGGHVKATSRDYGPCFIGSSQHSILPQGTFLSFGLLAALMIISGLDMRKAALILLACLLLTGLGSIKSHAQDSKGSWYVLAGAGYQMTSAKNNAIYFGTDQAMTVDSTIYPLVRAGYSLSDRWALEAGFRYDMLSGTMESVQDQGDDSVKGFSLLFGPVYRLEEKDIPLLGMVQPFLKADIGYRTIDSTLSYAVEGYDPAIGFEAALGLENGPFDLRVGYESYTLKKKDLAPGVTSGGDLDLSGLFAEVTYRFSFGQKKSSTPPVFSDSDHDGVPDSFDRCPDSDKLTKVNGDGCPYDDDWDGVFNDNDMCPDTPVGVAVNERGCAMDSDWDGVYDENDHCPDTPQGVVVNKFGCPLRRPSG